MCDLGALLTRWFFILVAIVVVAGLVIGLLSPLYFLARGPDWTEDWRALAFGLVLLAVLAVAGWHQLDVGAELERRKRRRSR
jgi:hypothetical protein